MAVKQTVWIYEVMLLPQNETLPCSRRGSAHFQLRTLKPGNDLVEHVNLSAKINHLGAPVSLKITPGGTAPCELALLFYTKG